MVHMAVVGRDFHNPRVMNWFNRRLTAVLDSTGEATEHTNVFRKLYKLKGSKS